MTITIALMNIGFFSGAFLGLRFKVWALLPASVVFLIIAPTAAIANGDSGWAAVLAIIGTIVALQIGYIAGSALSVTNSSKKIIQVSVSVLVYLAALVSATMLTDTTP